MKKKTFKVGVSYRYKDPKINSKIYHCRIDYHPWDRTKRLYYDHKGVEYSVHISQFNANDFVVSK